VIEDLRRVVGDQVGDSESARLVTVGTERDLIGVSGMTLAVAIDVDGMAFAPNYRAGEDALRLLIRLAMTLEPGRGRRTLLQTADPGQPVIEALRTGDPSSFLSNELAARKRSGFPPFGQLIALEVSGDDTASALIERDVRPLATVRGPAAVGDRQRWLIHATDLTNTRMALRQVTRTLRDRGAKVRIDVDPIDL
jgi:primosomal protein N' (replication factor Y)